MKYTRLLLLLILLLPFMVHAQKNELLVGLSAGISLPFGEFASSDYTITSDQNFENTGQFAELGTAFDISANYRLGYYLGFAGRVMGGTNKVNTSEYANALNSVINENGYEVTIASKGWGNFGLFAGGYFVIPVYDLYIDMRVMGGFINLFSPEIRYYFTKTVTLEEKLFVKEKYHAAAFAYNLGLGLKYKFSSNKFILFNSDFIGANIRKNDIMTLNPITKEEELVNMDVDYQVMTFTLGLGYIF